MKNKILTAIAVMASLCGYAQTKGTSAVGVGLNFNTDKYEVQEPSGTRTEERKNSGFSLGYGFFIKDNTKIGIDLNYSSQDQMYIANVSGSKSKYYGVGVNYQQYFPLISKFYAFGGAQLGFMTGKSEMGSSNSPYRKTDTYYGGISGGLAWFVSKRLALETSLLSANVTYLTSKDTGFNDSSPKYEAKSTAFNLTSSGTFSNLGFKVYLLF